VFGTLVGALAAFLAAVLGRGDVALIAATTGVIVVAVTALTIPMYTAALLAVFGDLTARKEGMDLEQRISATA
jgi:membrane glycosyltransferase